MFNSFMYKNSSNYMIQQYSGELFEYKCKKMLIACKIL